MTQPSSLPWVEKYRPLRMEDMAQQGANFRTITALIESNRLPHLLFYGPPGTGKTTAVQAIVRRLFGSTDESNVLELNASDERGINVVRSQIKSFVSTRGVFSSTGALKIVIMDEADAMTNAAQDALRRVIEKYVQYARFSPLLPEEMAPRLEFVIEKEGLVATTDGKKALLELSGGDMRKSTAASSPLIDEEAICHNCGVPTTFQIRNLVEKLLNLDYGPNYARTTCSLVTLDLSELVIERGYATSDIIRLISEMVLQYELPVPHQGYLLERLAYLEYAAASGISENIQIANLVGTFQTLRSL